MRSGPWLGAALAALLAGCAARQAPGDPFSGRPVRTASSEELARRLAEDAAGVVALKGKVTLTFQESATAGERTCRGALAARSPWSDGAKPGLFVEGYRSLMPTLFTLVSDGERFWLHVPSERVVYTGTTARGVVARGRELRLDARALLRALFVEPPGPDDALEVREDAEAYVLSIRRAGRLHRRLWVERRRFAVEREVLYDQDGREELVILRERQRERDGRLQPERLSVQDRVAGGSVLLEFDSLTVNPPGLDSRAFRPLTPPGARVETVDGTERDR
jgi:outer membrane lipoprotein-sorting protein